MSEYRRVITYKKKLIGEALLEFGLEPEDLSDKVKVHVVSAYPEDTAKALREG